MKITALAGGVGGAKMVDGFYRSSHAIDLTVIVNIGDDFEHYGLKICPDLDTVCYTLAGIVNPVPGWGRQDESYCVLDSLKFFDGPDWFSLGDKDLATHLERTRLINMGMTLSDVTDLFCDKWGIGCRIIPVSNDIVPTLVKTKSKGTMAFQEYFVKEKCEPAVTGFIFNGATSARPSPGVLDAIAGADVVVICPSNPWVSIDPILSIPDVRHTLSRKKVIAVSPIIGGHTLKGPAAKMFSELGIKPSALAVADHYAHLIAGIVIDQLDSVFVEEFESRGIASLVTDTIMRTSGDRVRLAGEVVDFARMIFFAGKSKKHIML